MIKLILLPLPNDNYRLARTMICEWLELGKNEHGELVVDAADYAIPAELTTTCCSWNEVIESGAARYLVFSKTAASFRDDATFETVVPDDGGMPVVRGKLPGEEFGMQESSPALGQLAQS